MGIFSNEINKVSKLFLILALTIIIVIIIIGYTHNKNNNVIESSVEIQKHNDSLKIKVDNLDSIKNAKVIEVKTLDNDSTVKLFYKLIK